MAEERTGISDRASQFRVLMAPRLQHAFGLACHLLGDRSEAEDACQEALLSAWRAWPQLRDRARFDAWLDRIVVNECLARLRRRRRTVPLQELVAEPASTDPFASGGRGDDIGLALVALPPEQLAVVVLRYWADLQTGAIAERLRIPHGTVRSRLHYALKALRAQLEKARGPADV